MNVQKKAGKQKLVCPVCKKEYEKKHYFDKHVLGHGSPAPVGDEGPSTSAPITTQPTQPDVSSLTFADSQPSSSQSYDHQLEEDLALFQSEEFAESCAAAELYFDVEDEEEEARRDGMAVATDNPTVKSKSTKGRKAILKCSECKTNYFTIDGYLKHKRVHSFSDILSHCPSMENIHGVSLTLTEEVLHEMQAELSGTRETIITLKKACTDLLEQKDSELWKNLVSVLTERLSDCVKKLSEFSLPTDLRNGFMKCTATFMSSDHSELLEVLEKLVIVPQRVLHILLASLTRRYSLKILTYILRSLNNKGVEFAQKLSDTYAITSQNTEDLDFKQDMHYIGGSNIRSILRKGFTIRNPDHEWLRVISAVKKNFLVKDASEMPSKELIAWTESRDRGGLVKINKDALDFFVNLGCIVKPLEHFDGSLFVDEVMEKVVTSELMILWDKLLQNDVTQSESLKLLYGLCYHFCNTWRSGIASRRLDEISYSTNQKHGTKGVAFRAKLAA